MKDLNDLLNITLEEVKDLHACEDGIAFVEKLLNVTGKETFSILDVLMNSGVGAK